MLKRFLNVLSGLFLAAWCLQAAAEVVPPDVLARSTTNDVIRIVKQDRDIKSGNKQKIYDLVEAKVLPHFDFRHMTQLAMGKHWRSATPEQQARLVDEFRIMMVRTYASALSSVADYRIEFKPVRMQPGDDDVTVGTEVSKPGMAPITIDYRMDRQNGAWKVYDVLVDSSSLVIANRSAFNAEVKKGGVDSLIAILERRNKSSN